MLGFFEGVGTFFAAPALILLALLEIRVPSQVVHVHVGAVGVEVEHLIDGVPQELDVVGNDHDPTGERLDPVAKPNDGVVIEVIGRLVKEQDIGIGEKNAGKFDPAALPTRQRPKLLIEYPVVETEGVSDLGGLRGGRPAALVGELLVELDVALHRALLARAFGRGHLVFRFPNASNDGIDSTH